MKSERVLIIILGITLMLLLSACVDFPEKQVVAQTQISEAQTKIPVATASAKVRSANITIDRTQIVLANLYPTRVTVRNTGNVDIEPRFDMTVIDGAGNKVCDGSPMFDEFFSLAPGESQTGELNMLGCSFKEDGNYGLMVSMLDDDYTKLATVATIFKVDYWKQFDFN